MRTTAVAIISALALVACNPSAPQGQAEQAAESAGDLFPDLTGAAYRADGNIMRDGQAMPIVMIRSGQKMRMEVSTPEGQSVIVSNGETGESFILATVAGHTRAMRTSQGTQQFSDPAASWGADIAESATRTGACSGAGQQGAEWSRTENGVVNTVCVTQDGIILKAAEAGQTVWETTSVARGPQSPDLFEVPPGVQVIDLGNIPGMAEALERAKAAGGQ